MNSQPASSYSTRYVCFVVLILTIASTFSIIDRQILNVMIGPVKRDLGGISDTQVSLIMGFAFSFFYSFLAFPAGWIADRFSRRNLMVTGIAGWSIMTVFCGAAGQYWQLFLARMGVGVGEATLGPAATSALSDYISPARLPLAMGVRDKEWPKNVPLLQRGELSQPGETVKRGFPRVILLDGLKSLAPNQSGVYAEHNVVALSHFWSVLNKPKHL